MRIFLNILGVLFAAVGIMWVLQGANLWTGNAMSGQSMWLIIGIVVLVVGVALLLFANLRKSKKG